MVIIDYYGKIVLLLEPGRGLSMKGRQPEGQQLKMFTGTFPVSR
jgi:hypothetical protein